MATEGTKEGLERMYNELVDPELRDAARRRAERAARIEDRKLDTGAYEKP